MNNMVSNCNSDNINCTKSVAKPEDIFIKHIKLAQIIYLLTDNVLKVLI